MQNRIKELLSGTGKTLATAESCTGGRIAHLITTVSGSSEYFKGGVVSYAVEVKNKILGVKLETVKEKGIVSSEVAAEMADGVREKLGVTYSVATTGWADCYGDEFEPAGTVWVGISGPHGTATFRYFSPEGKTRIEKISLFAEFALCKLADYIIDDSKD